MLCFSGALALLPSEDFLVGRAPTASKLLKAADGSLVLTNGLISRRFVTTPNFATVSLRQEKMLAASGPTEFLRGVAPEARIKLGCIPAERRRRLLPYAADALEGNTTTFPGIAVGGLRGQQRYAFFDPKQWNLTKGPDDFEYAGHTVAKPTAPWKWTPGQRNSPLSSWPPKGLQLRVKFRPPPATNCSCCWK